MSVSIPAGRGTNLQPLDCPIYLGMVIIAHSSLGYKGVFEKNQKIFHDGAANVTRILQRFPVWRGIMETFSAFYSFPSGRKQEIEASPPICWGSRTKPRKIGKPENKAQKGHWAVPADAGRPRGQGGQTSWMTAISAASPRRGPILMIRV